MSIRRIVLATLLLVSVCMAQSAMPNSPTAVGTPWFTGQTGSSTSIAFTQNTVVFRSFYVSAAVSATRILYNVATADNTANNYDLGIFDASGNLLAHVGATAGTTFASTAVTKDLPWAGAATLNLPPGRYLIGWTTNCAATCAALGGGASVPMPVTGSAGVTAGGALVTFTPPGDSFAGASMPMFALHN